MLADHVHLHTPSQLVVDQNSKIQIAAELWVQAASFELSGQVAIPDSPARLTHVRVSARSFSMAQGSQVHADTVYVNAANMRLNGVFAAVGCFLDVFVFRQRAGQLPRLPELF